MVRLSGLQREVLVLYRSCLRQARKKPEVRELKTPGESATNTSHRPVASTLKPLPGKLSSFSQVLVRELNLAARSEFEKHLTVEKRDFAAIEYLLRKGRRQLDAYSEPGIKDIK